MSVKSLAYFSPKGGKLVTTTMKKNVHAVILFMLVSIVASAATAFLPAVLDDISLAIRSGNAREVAKYFDTSVEITIHNESKVYSKSQAEMVLKDFFTKNPVSSFNVIHKGTSNEGSQYGIGTLVTNGGSFRTYVYIKQKGTAFFVQEIRFEKD